MHPVDVHVLDLDIDLIGHHQRQKSAILATLTTTTRKPSPCFRVLKMQQAVCRCGIISINGLTLRYAGGTQNVPPALANAGAALNLKGGSFVFSDLRLERSSVGLWVTGQGSPQIQSSRIVGN